MQADKSHPMCVLILHKICTEISISIISEASLLIDIDRCRTLAMYGAEQPTERTSGNACWLASYFTAPCGFADSHRCHMDLCAVRK